MIRFGIIGYGIMGKWYARIISESPRAQLVAVTSKSESSLQAARDTYGVAVYQDAEEMLDREQLDAVYIATPDPLHTPFAIAALKRGVHILLEKPMTMSLREAKAILETAKQSGALGTLRFGNRYSPPFLKIKEAIERGDVGEAVAVHARLNDRIYVPTEMISWADQTTPAWFLMSHLLDLVWWLLRKRPRRVSATGVQKVLSARGIHTYDVIQALVEYEDGVIGTFETGWILPNSMPSMVDLKVDVVGNRGASFVETLHQTVRVASDTYTYPGVMMVEVGGRLQGYLIYIFEQFLDAIEGKSPNPVPLEDGVLNVATLEATHRSLETGQWEPVPEV